MVPSQLHTKAREFTAQVPNMWRMMREARQFMYTVSPSMYYMSWFEGILGGIATLGGFAAVSVFFQHATGGAVQSWLHSQHVSIAFIIVALVAIVLYFLIRGTLHAIGNLRRSLLQNKVELLLEQEEINLLMNLDAGRLSDPAFMFIREKATKWHGRNAVSQLFTKQRNVFGALVGVLASLGLLAILNPLFIVLTTIPIVVGTLAEMQREKKDRAIWESMHLTRRLHDEYERCLMDPMYLLQGKLFCFTSYWRKRYNTMQNELVQKEQELEWFRYKWNLVNVGTGVCMLAIIMGYLGHGIADRTIAFSEVFLIWGSMQTLARSITSFSSSIGQIWQGCLDYTYREQFLTTKPLIDESKSESFRFPSTPKLELREVFFRYPREENLVLKGCSISITPNEKVAIVGQNGSGKSTLLRLLSKIYLPDEGQVLVDGLSISRITQSSWFEQILFATQDTQLPRLTVEEVLTGGPPRTADMNRLIQAAGHARAVEMITDEFPQQYEQQLGADWPDGKEPSTGQWQRLKITSAFYRLLEPAVRIGLFDEPMSQCDVETRERFYRELQGVSGKTIIVVAHDPVYLHYFQRVILMEHGCIVRDMCTREEIVAYQREAIPRFEQIERKGNHLWSVE